MHEAQLGNKDYINELIIAQHQNKGGFIYHADFKTAIKHTYFVGFKNLYSDYLKT